MTDFHTIRLERLRGLAGNPAVPAGLLQRLVDEQLGHVAFAVQRRRVWTEEQFEALAGHADVEVRRLLAEAVYLHADLRMRLTEDPSRRVLDSLAEGPEYGFWTWLSMPSTVLPPAGFERVLERLPAASIWLSDSPWAPKEIRDRLGPAWREPPTPPLSRAEAEELAVSDELGARLRAAGDPDTPDDVVERLARDPEHAVRLVVSMRPELSEEQRATIDVQIGVRDRVGVARWAVDAVDPEVQRRAAPSDHLGLRRSAARNGRLAEDLVAALAKDDDQTVRQLLCECHPGAPAEVVIDTYLEYQSMRSHELLEHPSLIGYPFADLADHDDPSARALVARDPNAAADIVERLSHDPSAEVRRAMAADGRLSPRRLDELFGEEETTGAAARNPTLPETAMLQILAS